MNTGVTLGDYRFTLLEDGTAEIEAYTGSAAALRIPGALHGHAVTAIRESAFSERAGLVSVEIPDGVRTIGDSAFFGCRSLRRASLPGGDLIVGPSAFERCAALEEVIFRKGGEGPVELDDWVFNRCEALRRVQLPDTLRRVGCAAFGWCGLASITLPEALERVETGAFYNCLGLWSVECRSKALALGDYAFWNCAVLERVALPERCTFGRKVFGRCGCVDSTGATAALAANLEGMRYLQPGPRLLTPRHMSYEWGVYGLGNCEPPSFLEVNCYADEAGLACDCQLFHFDIGNLEAAGRVEEDAFETDAERESQLAQAERLRAGEIDYFISYIYYYTSEDGCRRFFDALPEGRTLFDVKNREGIEPYYAVVYVREAGPLMPDVLCGWFERLSRALFGDCGAYRFPEGCLSREKAERSYCEEMESTGANGEPGRGEE